MKVKRSSRPQEERLRRLLSGVVVLAGCLAGAEAEAACNGSFAPFAVDENSQVDIHVKTTGPDCRHSYSSGMGAFFTGASIAKRPGSGSLTQIAPFQFVYRVKSGFKGQDQYAIRVCGQRYAKSGCATLTYHMTVQ